MIVPCYNRRHCLAQCLTSIARQKDVRLEIIVVDDGSADGSAEAVAQAAVENPQVSLFIIPLAENGGQAIARNAGLNVATGEFIAFLDSDDLYGDSRALAHLLAAARGGDLDMVLAPFLLCRDGYNARLIELPSPPPAAAPVRDWPQIGNSHSFWQGLYRRTFLDRANLRFDERIRHREDRPFLVAALLAADRIGTIATPLVQYNQGSEGAVTLLRDRLNFTQYIRHLESLIETIEAARAGGRSSVMFELVNARIVFAYLAGYWIDLVGELYASSDLEDQALFTTWLARMRTLASGLPAFYELAQDFPDDSTLAEGWLDMVRLCVETGAIDRLMQLVRGSGLDLRDTLAIAALLPEENRREGEACIARYLSYRRLPIEQGCADEARDTGLEGRKVFLHVGFPKAGSSSLQNCFEANRIELLRQGVLYPVVGVWRERGMRRLRNPGHVNIVTALAAEESSAADAVRALGREVEAAEAAGFPIHTVVLSSEALTLPDGWDSGRALDRVTERLGVPTEVVWVQRRHDTRMESLFVNHAENPFGEAVDFPTVVSRNAEAGLLDYMGMAARMRAAPRVTAMHVARHEELVAGGGIIPWCCAIIGIDAERLVPIERQLANHSTSLYRAAFINTLKFGPGLLHAQATAAYDAAQALPDYPDFRAWGDMLAGHHLLRDQFGSAMKAYAGGPIPMPVDGPEGQVAFASDMSRILQVVAAVQDENNLGGTPASLPLTVAPSAEQPIVLSLLTPETTLVTGSLPAGRSGQLWLFGGKSLRLNAFWWDGNLLAAIGQSELQAADCRDGELCRIALMENDFGHTRAARVWPNGRLRHLFPANDPAPPSTQVVIDELAALGPAAMLELVEAEFDADHYLMEYPDIVAAEVDPLNHFMVHGWREGRNPNSWFYTSDYLLAHPELIRRALNPLAHHVYSRQRTARTADV